MILIIFYRGPKISQCFWSIPDILPFQVEVWGDCRWFCHKTSLLSGENRLDSF